MRGYEPHQLSNEEGGITARVPLAAEDGRTFGRNNEEFYWWKGGRATGAAIAITRCGARPFNVL